MRTATRLGTLEWIIVDQVDLYHHVLPPGENIPISVDPSPVEHSVPMEDKIEQAVKRLRNHRCRGPSGIRVEHLKEWLVEVRKEETVAEK